jgi:Na+/glutamate symporter
VHLCVWVTLAVVLAVILGSPLQTWGHSDPALTLASADASQQECQALQSGLPAAHPTSSAMRGAPLTVILFIFTAVAVAQCVWRWRRTTALGLVLALGTFTFGIAVHSVHHLSEPEKSADCLVFSASQQVSGTLAEPCDVHVPGPAVTTASPDSPDVPAFILGCRCDLPRAPPSFLS